MTFLDKTGLQNLTNKLVQGDAIKVASSKGTTVKEVIDNIQRECDNVALPNTMIIENRVNEFKVGQGRNIDVSRDVEEGLSQIQLQGQTYQNLCGSDASCQLISSLMPHFMIENYNDKVVVAKINNNNEGWRYLRNKTLKSNMIKPNTTYTLFFKYESNFDVKPVVSFEQGDGSQQLSDGCVVTKIKDSVHRCVIKTIASFNDKKIGAQVLYFKDATPNKTGEKITLYKDMILLEGDYSQIPAEELPQYFEGIKSSFEDKVANINVQGKNFFDVSKLTAFKVNNVNIFWSGDKLLLNGAINHTWTSFATSNALPKGTYSLRVYDKGVYWGGKAKIWGYNSEGQLIANVGNGTTFTIEEDAFNIKLVIEGFQSGTMIDAELTIQIERAAKFTPYEPYYHYNYKFDIKEPLRRLPNDVCDEIRNNNGKWELVRRIGKTVLDETYDYALWGNTPSDGYFTCHANNYLQGKDITFSANKKNVICDTFAVSTGTGAFRNMSFYFTNPHITVLSSEANSISKFKEWIAKNPITLYYELVIPIITPIDPIEFNVSQGTTISINSDIVPISTHEVILNRSGQIEQGIELIADLRNRINKLEKAYDSNLIATQYRLNNLKLNYELEREED